ncbi:hypothetical protein [Candidatus Laterigemmans baculatus]|uniref:hypothetical protein n=1 Tax=Candidatus Laterigemmans baculatus TaxID=2770505 RepID=UPI0013DBFF53|nr:hypothetical protein [Candidatus Laterigemmans baculatus]
MRWLLAALVTLVLHYSWEMLQAPLFTDFVGMSVWEHAWPCFRAALGDLAIAAVSYGMAALLVFRVGWPFQDRWSVPFAICVSCGLIVTVGFEIYALATDRWAYGPRMPIVAGIALAPLLQWLVVPSLTLLTLQRVASLD